MSLQKNVKNILAELDGNASFISEEQANNFVSEILAAKHIFLAGAGRSGLAVRAFGNRLLHLGFKVSIVGEISSPHSQQGDLVIICSGSGETGSLVSLAQKASKSGVKIALVSMRDESTIGKLASANLTLKGQVKGENEEKEFTQPMGAAFEQLAFLAFDGMVLELMDRKHETSDSMFARHADFE
ncbi:6-phospho 3-hexuloisomerase [Streptococcus cuniculi]|uniref:6-phospho 3-hexuloisomerase n=1 Tax=Streptococcus cuniculi TaxID=1432788 RepID=A0A1Q8E7Z9_9STRE|nr:6-phospho-3-hexuloisomerase [Streptococcus cuniculi]OLF47912.1 6-phospho 3-hexuloisomerase [Streptococcus cuniculi]